MFKKYFIITPSIEMKYGINDYKKNIFGEIGKKVKKNFQYDSGSNDIFLSQKQILKSLETN